MLASAAREKPPVLVAILIAAAIAAVGILAYLWLPLVAFLLISALVALVGGLLLWLPSQGERDQRAILGQGLLSGFVVTIALLLVWIGLDEQQHDAAEADRRSDLRLTVELNRDLTGITLRDKGLRDFFLVGKRLRRADLRNTDLRKNNLTTTDLTETNLRRAKLQGAVLLQARLDGADMTAAKMQGTALNQASLRRTNLSRAYLTDARAINARMIAVNLPGNSTTGKLHRC